MSKPKKSSKRKRRSAKLLASVANTIVAFFLPSSGSKLPNPAAAILTQLSEMSDNICSLVGPDSSLLASQASKILSLATTESKFTLIIYYIGPL